MRNSFIGSVNGQMRGDLFVETLFLDLDDPRIKS